MLPLDSFLPATVPFVVGVVLLDTVLFVTPVLDVEAAVMGAEVVVPDVAVVVVVVGTSVSIWPLLYSG
uniref:Uncharacterized protein n=1 Tax=Anopheles darlingi TaxID=43151 RepID=A0A2M4DG40_ANODA